jgi:hypothetical protein
MFLQRASSEILRLVSSGRTAITTIFLNVVGFALGSFQLSMKVVELPQEITKSAPPTASVLITDGNVRNIMGFSSLSGFK